MESGAFASIDEIRSWLRNLRPANEEKPKKYTKKCIKFFLNNLASSLGTSDKAGKHTDLSLFLRTSLEQVQGDMLIGWLPVINKLIVYLFNEFCSLLSLLSSLFEGFLNEMINYTADSYVDKCVFDIVATSVDPVRTSSQLHSHKVFKNGGLSKSKLVIDFLVIHKIYFVIK